MFMQIAECHSFYGWVIFHCIYNIYHIFFIHSSLEEHLALVILVSTAWRTFLWIFCFVIQVSGFPGGSESACQCRRYKRHRFNPSVRKIPCIRKWQLLQYACHGEFHGQRSLVGYSPWVTKSWTWLGNWIQQFSVGSDIIYYLYSALPVHLTQNCFSSLSFFCRLTCLFLSQHSSKSEGFVLFIYFLFSLSQFSSVQSLSHVQLFATPWIAACQASLSITTLRVYLNSCPSSQWCHPANSSSVVPFSSCSQSLPASGSFPMSQHFAWGGQSIGVSASASVQWTPRTDLL